jgi:hypothetical protein
MIKMRGTNGKRQMILLGLSEGNLMRLREKKPIVIHGEEMRMPNLDIIICWGETEDTLAKELAHMIGPETVRRDHRGEKKQ